MSPSAPLKEEGSQDPVPVSAGGTYTIRVSHIVLSHTTTPHSLRLDALSGHLCWLQDLCQALEYRCFRARRTTCRDSFYSRQIEQPVSPPSTLFYIRFKQRHISCIIPRSWVISFKPRTR